MKYLIIFILALYIYGPLQGQCPTLVWSDEFSGSSLDLNNWNYQVGDGCPEGICGWGNNELQYYQEQNIEVSNGTLKITAKTERVRSKKYTSGRINSKGKADFTYGRYEAKIKLPYGDGLWPAFWMLSTTEPYGTWPQSGEIDIMELVASDPKTVLGYMHYGDLYPNNQNQGATYQLPTQEDFPLDFHEFAIEWEPGEIRWFVDGVLFSVKKAEDVAPFNWPFDHDFHFLLNVAVGGNLGGTVNDNMLPATMEVDYVRVYSGFKPYIAGNDVVQNQAQGAVFSLANVSQNVNVTWSVPSDATIVSGQGSNEIVVNFGDLSGNVSASFDDGCAAQTLDFYVDVEQPYIKGFSFENFDDPPTAIYASSTGQLTELTNPFPNSINNSTLCGQYDRNSAEQYDLIVYDVSNITNGSQYVDKSKKFYMDVYTSAPVGTTILIQLENDQATPSNYPTGRHSRYIATISENNNWERLIFSLLDRPDPSAPDNSITTMIILPASNSFTGDTYYIDNLDSYEIDNGSTSNIPPTVSITNPSEGTQFDSGSSVTISADATDTDGTISQVEFFVDGSSIGTDATSPYSIQWQIGIGNYALTAIATDNEGATTTSGIINITGNSVGDPTSVYVSNILTGTQSASKGAKFGKADVTILDDQGNPASNAVVTGTFSGTFNETASSTTNSNGIATILTQNTAKGSVSIDFCVDNVMHTLPYDPQLNTTSCSAALRTTQMVTRNSTFDTNKELNYPQWTIFPNPTKDVLYFKNEKHFNGFSGVIFIYDVSGELKQLNNMKDENQLDISSLLPGCYIVKIQNQHNQNTYKKLIVH